MAASSIAKRHGGREVYKMDNHDNYTSVTFEFASRKGAREFMQSVNRLNLSLYAPHFCDLFKQARVTVFVRKGSQK